VGSAERFETRVEVDLALEAHQRLAVVVPPTMRSSSGSLRPSIAIFLTRDREGVRSERQQ